MNPLHGLRPPSRQNPLDGLMPVVVGGIVGGLAYEAVGKPLGRRLGIVKRNPDDRERMGQLWNRYWPEFQKAILAKRPKLKDYEGLAVVERARSAVVALLGKGATDGDVRGAMLSALDPKTRANPRKRRNPDEELRALERQAQLGDPAAIQRLAAMRARLAPPKPETHLEARLRLRNELAARGWQLSIPTLKIPHATSPDGQVRIWWKPQAILVSYGTNFKVARSLHVEPRTVATDALIAEATRLAAALRRIDLDIRENPGGPTLQDAAESWARSLGLRVPARGSAAWGGLWTAYQRAVGGRRANPDEDLRALEREARAGDHQAATKLGLEMVRRGLLKVGSIVIQTSTGREYRVLDVSSSSHGLIIGAAPVRPTAQEARQASSAGPQVVPGAMHAGFGYGSQGFLPDFWGRVFESPRAKLKPHDRYGSGYFLVSQVDARRLLQGRALPRHGREALVAHEGKHYWLYRSPRHDLPYTRGGRVREVWVLRDAGGWRLDERGRAVLGDAPRSNPRSRRNPSCHFCGAAMRSGQDVCSACWAGTTDENPPVKVCGRCRKRDARWTCRACGRRTCEHLCALKKQDGTATCGTCKMKRNPDADLRGLEREARQGDVASFERLVNDAVRRNDRGLLQNLVKMGHPPLSREASFRWGQAVGKAERAAVGLGSRFVPSKEGMKAGYWKVLDLATGQAVRSGFSTKTVAMEVADEFNRSHGYPHREFRSNPGHALLALVGNPGRAPRRGNFAPVETSKTSYSLRLPANRVKKVVPVEEAMAVPGMKEAVARYRKFHGCDPQNVIAYDDGRPGNEAGFILGRTPTVTYTDVPPGSNKGEGDNQGVIWEHETSKKHPTYIAHLTTSKNTVMIGDMAHDGVKDWLRERGERRAH